MFALILFIDTTSFVREEGLLVNRPKANNKPASDAPMIIIRLSDAGYVSFNNKPVDIERLSARIENFLAKYDSKNVVVIPSYNTTHENVVNVIDQVALFDDLVVSIGK
ncbi:ExbD/TolR family protein [Colwelliaceae bacterium 6471]